MISILATGPAYLVKIQYADGTEVSIGFARGLNYSVFQGQKMIFVVDNPFPVEIAQGAAPSYVRATLNIYMPKGATPETLGLVSYRQDTDGTMLMVGSRYFNLRVYDRSTTQRVFSMDYCKVGSYTVNLEAKQVVQCALNIEGFMMTPNNNTANNSTPGLLPTIPTS